MRYTIFSPNGAPEKASSELWAIFFNGETHQHTALYREFPLKSSNSSFSSESVDAQVSGCRLNEYEANGKLADSQNYLEWALRMSGGQKELFLLPQWSYFSPFPKAKVMVNSPLKEFSGKLTISNEEIAINNWVGSLNHK